MKARMFVPEKALLVTSNKQGAGITAFAARAVLPGVGIVKKLSLNVEALEISTFETAVVETETGTVEAFAATKAHQYTCDPLVGTCFGYTCAGAGC